MSEDCTGTMHFFAKHKTLGPATLGQFDHFHDADFVVADGGNQLSMIFITLKMRDGTTPVPIESLLWTGHRQ